LGGVELGLVLPPTPRDSRYFPESGYRIDNDVIWEYFLARGGVDTFGYPVSRTFPLLGFWTQIFQRHVIQIGGLREPGAHPMNLLDPGLDGLLPVTSVNSSSLPAHDPQVAAAAPPPGTPSYGAAVLRHLRATVPDTWGGQPVRFLQTYLGAAPGVVDPDEATALVALEVWGFPTSRPARDPNNAGFIYQRFQRGVLHHDAATGTTRGLLLADVFKSVLTGERLPPDVAAQMAVSPFLFAYDPAAADGLAAARAPAIRDRGRPTVLAHAFLPSSPSAPQ
jgi:hypothetical protein